MPFTVEPVYQNGVLKPAQPLPLREHETVQVTIQPKTNWVAGTYGICGWTRDPEELRRLALHPKFDLPDSGSLDPPPLLAFWQSRSLSCRKMQCH